MSTSPILFTVEEALNRLSQTKGQGCLLVFNSQESIHIFVRDGTVLSALSGNKSGEDALDEAITMKDSAYRWIPDAEPSHASCSVDIREYMLRRSQAPETRYKTIKMASYERKEKKLDFQYFFVPEEEPNTKLRIRKTTNVVGRERTSDLFVESFQVSRRHCLLQVTDRGLLVKDLDSTNGTFVNGILVRDAPLKPGDRLELGPCAFAINREELEALP
jgi:hypothetical protein